MRVLLVLCCLLASGCGPRPEVEVLSRSPAYARAYASGLDFLERYRLHQAERAFARCTLLDGQAYEGHWQLGRVRLVQGRIEEGIRSLERALELEPGLGAARELIGETLAGRGDEALEEGRFAEAERYFARALEVDGRAYAGHYGAAITAIWQEQYGRADSLLRRAIDQYPQVPELRWHLKMVRAKLGGGDGELPEPYRFADRFAAAGDAGGRFSEVAREMGVDKFDGGRSSAWADYDGDGDLDLVALGHPHLAYYRNDGARFAERTQAAGLALPEGGIGSQVADYDNDGDADLYVTRDGWFGGGRNLLFENGGRGVFADVTGRAGVGDEGSSFCAAWGDYDRDGWVDLYVANGTGATGDSTNVLYRNRGNGTFEQVGERAGVAHRGQGLSTAWGDVDGDGWPDLYLCNFTEPNVLYRNRGDGSFADITAQAGAAAAHIDGFITFFLDYDNDGHLDIFVGNWSPFEAVLEDRLAGRATRPRERPALLRNKGDGTFEEVADRAGLARALGTMSGVPGDVDGDGWTDLYLGNGGPQMGRREPDALFRNRGDGIFEEIAERVGLGHPGKSHGVSFADYDGDGDLDLYVPVGGARPGDQWPNALYRNEGFGNHWLALRLEGRRSNRDGIGARVLLRAGGNLQVQEVASGYSFGNSSSLEVEFGLGAQERVEEVEIRWPSGQVDRYKDPGVDRRLRLREGGR